MTARRRRKRLKREVIQPKSSVLPAAAVSLDHKEPAAVKSRFLVALGWDGSRPIPLPAVAGVVFVSAFVLGMPFHSYVTCPQAARGVARIVASVVVGLPIGGGFTTVLMIAGTLMVTSDRSERTTSAITVAVERAGLGAAYGTLMSILATLGTVNSSGEKGCGTDLLANISNGATWGTMLGFTFALLMLRRAMVREAVSTNYPYAKRMFVNASKVSLVTGTAVTALLIAALMQGNIWPQ